MDWWTVGIYLFLIVLGWLSVCGASYDYGEPDFLDFSTRAGKQLMWIGCSLCLGFILLMLDSRMYDAYAYLVYGILMLLLLGTIFNPHEIKGSRSWIVLGPVSIQPMEFVKISLALYLAYFMSSKQDLIKTFSRGVIPPFAVTGLFCFLLLLQPDFGSAVVLAGILFFMCIAGGTRFVYLFFTLALAVAGAMALAIASPYRLRRLLAFLDPFEDAHNTGYQLVQSLLAFGSGGFFGVGVGASRQKMFYLPESHNDFIMSVLAEELGFVGVTVVMLLFALLFWRCYRVIMGQQNLRDRLTSFGITCIIAMGAVMNLAVVMGVAPPKGVPMPFLSYGGSNLVATLLCVGLLLNFSRTARE